MKHWHILGAGAIGCLFAARLGQAGVSCSLVLRDAGPSSREFVLEDERGRHTLSLPATAAIDSSPIDHLLITTKAYDVEAALRSVRHRLQPGNAVLILVNGMGLLEIAAAIVPEAKLFAGTTTQGAHRTGARSIRHAGSGITRLGAAGSSAKPDWLPDWQAAPLACEWETDIRSALWHKLAINCAINPLTALHRVRNGELASDAALAHEVGVLCREIAAVSEAAGYGGTAGRIEQDTLEVIRRTAANQSSMLQDIRAGRRTEIEFITGYLVRRADALGVSADRNRELLERIRRLEP